MKNYLSFHRGTLIIKLSKENPSLIKEFADFHIKFFYDRIKVEYRTEAYQLHRIEKILSDLKIKYEMNWTEKNLNFSSFRSPNLYSYQTESINKWIKHQYRGIISLPTGSGKTVVALNCIKLLNVTTLILVPTRSLLEQWIPQVEQAFSIKCGKIGDGDFDLKSITVSTFSSAYNKMDLIGKYFQFLIVDEVHHFGNGTQDEALIMSLAKFRLGITATLPSEDQTKIIEKYLGDVVHQNTIQELSGKYLAPFNYKRIPLKLSPLEQKKYDLEREYYLNEFKIFRNSQPNKTNWKDFINFCTKVQDGHKIMTAFRRTRRMVSYPSVKRNMLSKILQFHRNQKVLIFTYNTVTAIKVSQEFLIPVITSDIKTKERQQILSSFKSGTLSKIVSCKVLNEGCYIPDAEVAIILGGDSCSRSHIQRIGRVLRSKEGKHSYIYELIIENTHETKHAKTREIK